MGNPDLGPNLFTGLHLQEALRPLAAGMVPEEGHFLWKGGRDHLAKHKKKNHFLPEERPRVLPGAPKAAISICDALSGPCWRGGELITQLRRASHSA